VCQRESEKNSVAVAIIRCELQHTATQCNTLQHTATHFLQHAAAHCNTLAITLSTQRRCELQPPVFCVRVREREGVCESESACVCVRKSVCV